MGVTCTTGFFYERSLVFYPKNPISGNFVEMLLILFCDITMCYRNLWDRKDILENRVKSCYFTLPFANSRCHLTTAWHPSGANCTSAPGTVVVGPSPKKGYENQARGIARGKRKRRGTQMWTGERSPFSPSPWRIFSSYAHFSGSACPGYSGTSPLGHLYSRYISIHGTQNFVPEKCSHNLYICYLYLGERDTFVGPKTQV